jgi:hypothetical protein
MITTMTKFGGGPVSTRLPGLQTQEWCRRVSAALGASLRLWKQASPGGDALLVALPACSQHLVCSPTVSAPVAVCDVGRTI